MIHRITLILASLAAIAAAQPSLTNNNLDNLTATAKDNLEALGVLTDDAGPDNAAVAAAIAEDPKAVRESLVLRYLDASDYGVTYSVSDDSTAEANAAAITAAAAASSTQKIPLLIRGTVYIKGAWTLAGADINIIGNEATVIQKDVSHNGVTASESNPPSRLVIIGVNFTGQGAATHDAAGICLRRTDNAYFIADADIRDCWITGFRKGVTLGGITKLATSNLNIDFCRVGMDLYDVQTSLLLNSRIVNGDGDADSACFHIDGSLVMSSKILMGEFGGSNIARFAVMPSGWLNVEAANLEAFSGDQIVNLTGIGITKRVVFRNCRFGFSRTATQSVVSCQMNGTGTGVPSITLQNNIGTSSSWRLLELWGANPSSLIYGPADGNVTGPEIKTVYCETQGGTILQTRYEQGEKSGRILDAVARAAIANGTDVSVCSYTIPVGLLNRTGQTVRMRAAGSTAGNGDTKQLKIKVGSTTAVDFGAIAMNASSWRIEAEMMYGAWGGGNGNWKLSATLFYDSSVITKTWDNSGNQGNSAVAFAITATTNTTGDIVKAYHKYTFERNAESQP